MGDLQQAAGKLMVALDYPDVDAARKLISELADIPCYMKVGMQLFYASGPDFVRELKSKGYRVFLDLKMHDIPNTVKGGANSITRLGVDMFNVHAAGGKKMMAAALEGAMDAVAADSSLRLPEIIAVTHLTSTNQQTLNNEIGIPGNIRDAVAAYAVLAKQAGLHGVVASPLEVGIIKQQCGSDFKTVTPGIRPLGSAASDQSRTLTPQEAIRQGTDYIVVGRPITQADSPRQAAESIIEEMLRAW